MEKEEIKDRRRKELAILKAENEMMEDIKNNISKSSKYDGVEKAEVIDSIIAAQSENLQKGRSLYGATEQEINASEYGQASEYYVNKYEDRLRIKKLTDASLREKNLENADKLNDTVTVSYANEEVSIEDKEDTIEVKEEERGYVGSLGGYMRKKKSLSSIEADNDNVQVKYSGKLNIPEIPEEKPYVENKEFEIPAIPSYVQYDVIPLPSNGQCYKNKRSRVPVAYLTASDENLITAPNLYRDGKLLDILLKRKILDPTIDPYDLCKGDRDCIILWLRATGYGYKFPIKVADPETDKEYQTVVQLDQLKMKPFNLKGDENGWFEYRIKRMDGEEGDMIKFKYLSRREEIELQSKAVMQDNDRMHIRMTENLNELSEEMVKNRDNIREDEFSKISSHIEAMKRWNENYIPNSKGALDYGTQMTDAMIAQTMSVNGNEDREYISNYIRNMRARYAYDYRKYINDNEPGMDFSITINRPESLGGGSFKSFLNFNSFLFLSIA